MVDERGYTRRVAPQAGAAAPSVSAASFGAGVGAALEQAGNVLNQENLETERLERGLRENAEWSQFQQGFAKSREEFTLLADDSRQSDDPGHARGLGESWAVREDELIGRLSSEQLKQRARGTLGEWGSRYRTREALWEEGRQAEIAIDGYQDSLGIAEGRVRRLQTPTEYRDELAMAMDGIGGLSVSDEIREGLIEETEQRLAVAYIRGMTDRDPVAAQALIDSGAFDGVLKGDQTEVLRNGTDVEIRRIQAQQRREAAEQQAQLREQISYFQQRQGNGFYDDPAEFEPFIAAAQAIGDASRVEELRDLQADTGFVKIWGPANATAVQREQRLTVLAGKESRSELETRELDFLRRNSSGWAAEEERDPVGQAIERGGSGAPPPIDFGDPASLLARGQWAAARTAEGMPVSPLSRTEAQALSRIFDSGANGREEVLDLLSNFQPSQAMAAAAQMDPQDRTLPIIATLNRSQRTTAMRGREILQDNSKFLEDRLADPARNPREVMMAGRTGLDEALRAVPYDQREAIAVTAQQMMAGAIERSDGQWNEERYAEAINYVLGAEGRGADQRGGIAVWGERSFLLPEGVSLRGFANEAVRIARESDNPPVNPDGSPARLSRAYPVRVGPDLYEFHTGSGNPVRRQSGSIYTITVRAR